MTYYVLRVDRFGDRLSVQVSAEKHLIDAASLAEAKAEADRIVGENYALDDLSYLKMFDETGLVAARNPDGDWRAQGYA